MKVRQLNLWDLLTLRRPVRPSRRRSVSGEAARPAREASGKRRGMAQRYDDLTRDMLAAHGIRVRKWRTSMSGVAWEVHYRDGSVTRLIEAPRPKGPMSAAVFLHEVGHHAIGFRRYRPRCLEEYHAWRWALDQMECRGLTITDGVRRRMHESLHYAVMKARRRGLKDLPPELEAFAIKPPGRPQRSHGRRAQGS